jgi:hypothetical protein
MGVVHVAHGVAIDVADTEGEAGGSGIIRHYYISQSNGDGGRRQLEAEDALAQLIVKDAG